MSHSAYKDYKVDYHLAKRVRLITDKYTDSESNETIQVRADSTTQGATGTDQHKVGVHIALPAAPVDGDEITVRDMGNQSNKTNEIAITASHNIDNHTVEPGSLNPTPKWPDDKESSQYFENQKSILIKNRGGRFGEVRFMYDATKQRWDTSIGGAAGAPGTFVHNNARLRLPATELTTEFGGFLKIHLIDTMPAWWVDPNAQTDGQSITDAGAWCVPTTFANWVGWFKKKDTSAGTPFSGLSDWPLTSTLDNNTWHHHQFENVGRPAIVSTGSTYAENMSDAAADALTDIGWYLNTNNGGAKDATLQGVATDGAVGTAHTGTYISDFYVGLKQFMLKAGYTSASLDAAMGLAWNKMSGVWTVGSLPAGTGAASKDWLESGSKDAWVNIKAELDANRPFIAAWRHWDLKRYVYEKAGTLTTLAPLAPETMGTDTNGQIQLANFPISFYEWVSATGTYSNDLTPNGEVSNYDSGTPLSTMGHTVLVVGYVHVSNGFTGTNSSKYHNFGFGDVGNYTQQVFTPAPDADTESVYLLVLDDWIVNGQYTSNKASPNTEHGINGIGATTPTLGGGSVTTRHIKAIPIARTGNWTQAGGGGLNMLLASYFINETGIATS